MVANPQGGRHQCRMTANQSGFPRMRELDAGVRVLVFAPSTKSRRMTLTA
jgi:hypothetical protein